jgi:hypothetical protein
MKKQILLAVAMLAAGSLLAADAGDQVKNAAKKLGEAANYSWKAATASGGGQGAGRFGGPTEGKTQKDGLIALSMTRGEVTTEAVVKGEKGAIKTPDGWKSLAEVAADDGSGQFNPSRFMAMRLRNYKAPVAEAADLVAKAKELKQADDAIAGDLTEAGAKDLLSFRPPGGGGGGPEVSNAKGTVKFWVKEGALVKYEFNLKGTISFNGNDRDMDRTTTVEIKDVGTTKVSVPEEAAKKLQ